MNLIFIHSDGSESLITKTATEDNVLTKIKEFVAELNPNYKIYYIRTLENKRGTMYDVGSHTEFFLLEGGNPID